MKLTTKTEITLVLSGPEADELGQFLYQVEQKDGGLPPIPGQLLHRLQAVPSDGKEVYGQ